MLFSGGRYDNGERRIGDGKGTLDQNEGITVRVEEHREYASCRKHRQGRGISSASPWLQDPGRYCASGEMKLRLLLADSAEVREGLV